jgi:hypothetical protein
MMEAFAALQWHLHHGDDCPTIISILAEIAKVNLAGPYSPWPMVADNEGSVVYLQVE